MYQVVHLWSYTALRVQPLELQEKVLNKDRNVGDDVL